MSGALLALADAGQSAWLDYLHRESLEKGELARLIAHDGIRGVTSNPAIFQKAIGESKAYDGAIAERLARSDAEPMELYEGLAIADVQAAADALRPCWEALNGRDGFVSLEVSPYLAHDTVATVAEAGRLWAAVDRPNLMIKVPGTAAGVPAIRDLIATAVNVNVTLLFSVEAYLAVAEAHLDGLEALRTGGGDVSKVHGVASFFVSRIDTAIDKAVDDRLAAGDPNTPALKALRGKVAIANAKVAYRRYLEMLRTPRWRSLAEAGAAPQRLLWASTGTKDPAFSDVVYVDGLIGPDTVNTMPPATMDAFRDHGRVGPTLEAGVADAEAVLAEAERLDLDLRAVTTRLAVEGVDAFSKAFDDLLGAVAAKRIACLGAALNLQTLHAGILKADLQSAVTRAAREGWPRRLWARDASLWTDSGEDGWLDWLDAAHGGAVDQTALDRLAVEVGDSRPTHVVLLGMGGSSLGPEVIGALLGPMPGRPELLVLDSTDPAQVSRIAGLIDPATSLFIVASKSGSTLEPDVLHRYFHDVVVRAVGADKAGERFVAITDPGSALEAAARDQGFRHIFLGRPGIGGRYSVLSHFGMVPAAMLGFDTGDLLARAAVMARACAPSAPPSDNPGVALGLLMGVAARSGRDKLTVFADAAVADFGAWLEQLVAESTGKQGVGIIPIVGEPARAAESYGGDRLFVDLRLAGERDAARDALLNDLQALGHPIVRIVMTDRQSVFQEFVRWEVATAIAAAVMGINAFDQPDVEASKIKTRALTDEYERVGVPVSETPELIGDGLSVFAVVPPNGPSPRSVGKDDIIQALAQHIQLAESNDYIAILAYLDRNPKTIQALEAVRAELARRSPSAVIVQFGPRFLHSTGQAYKGGPNSGVFIQITAQVATDVSVPGRKATFGVIEAAQARGDLAVLVERGRRALRLDVGRDVSAGLEALREAATHVIGA